MWLYVLSKIKNWWYFLAIFGFIFLAGQNVYAYNENFDAYSTGNLNANPHWQSVGGNPSTNVVTNSQSKSSPNSVTGDGSGVSLNNNFNSGQSVFFSALLTSCVSGFCGRFGFYSTTTTKDLCAVEFHTGTGGNFELFDYGGGDQKLTDLPLNTWNDIGIFEDSNSYCFIKSTSTDWVNIGQLGVDRRVPAEQIIIDYISATTFLDDINSVDNSFDRITWLNPTDNFPLNEYNYSAPITSPQFFNWDIDYTMSSSTIHAFPSDIPQILVEYVNASSSVVHTVTFANTDLSFSFYIQGSTYNVLSDDRTDFPTDTGIVTAEADLWRTHLIAGHRYYDDILASSTIQFYIATSTPTTGNTAWCNNLCADLDLGTATTSSFWGSLIPNFLNSGICAIRYGACYLFWPDSTVIGQLSNTYNNFKISFPFNVYYDLASTTQGALATSTNMSGSFPMPFITTAGKATTITVLSSSSVPNLIGQTNSNLFRTTAGYLIWLITAGGIAFMAFTIL